jgi:hypothetical protein
MTANIVEDIQNRKQLQARAGLGLRVLALYA